MFVRIRSKVEFPLDGTLTICFNVKWRRTVEIGHLLKSPMKKIPALGYNERAMSNLEIKCSNKLLLSLEGG